METFHKGKVKPENISARPEGDIIFIKGTLIEGSLASQSSTVNKDGKIGHIKNITLDSEKPNYVDIALEGLTIEDFKDKNEVVDFYSAV